LPPGTQSTPPHTPRTRSHDGTISHNSSVNALAALRTLGPAPATTGPVLGKISVEISEGRGFTPCYDPYIVCQFQWSEYISQGPINADVDQRQNANLRQPNGIGGVAMRRTDSGSRPRAIPMSSRQSSHTGRDATEERSTLHEVTDPKWEHKTVL
jgi:protein-serine/threonine kinase